jgi:hypothetical protein
MAAIEQDRRWEELKPRFTVFLEKSSGDCAKLHVAFVPGRLDYLDEVRLAILDEVGHDHWTYGLPDGVTEGEADAFVCPYEFNTDASEQVASNRWSEPRRFSHLKGNNWGSCHCGEHGPGRWMGSTTPEKWCAGQEGKPIRLQILCRREGYDFSLLLQDVET